MHWLGYQLFFIILIFSTIIHCQLKELELTKVNILPVIRLDANLDDKKVQAIFEAAKLIHSTVAGIEILVKSKKAKDTAMIFLPIYNADSIENKVNRLNKNDFYLLKANLLRIIKYAQKTNTKLVLIFNNTSETDDINNNTYFETNQYSTYTKTLINLLTNIPLDQINTLIIGIDGEKNDLLNQSNSNDWEFLVNNIRKIAPKQKLGYALQLFNVTQFQYWHLFDEISIIYEIPPEQNYKSIALQIHPQICKLADSLNKPIAIRASNLLEKDKLLQLKNQLRFWKGNTTVIAVHLNTIYDTPSVLDSETRFGIAKDTSLINFIISRNQLINN
jgi:hypothetical protein